MYISLARTVTHFGNQEATTLFIERDLFILISGQRQGCREQGADRELVRGDEKRSDYSRQPMCISSWFSFSLLQCLNLTRT